MIMSPGELRKPPASPLAVRVVNAAIVLLAGFGAATARLFVWPPHGMPRAAARLAVAHDDRLRVGAMVKALVFQRSC